MITKVTVGVFLLSRLSRRWPMLLICPYMYKTLDNSCLLVDNEKGVDRP